MSGARRSRCVRTTEGHQEVGSGRDHEVLASLAWAGVLSTPQIERLHFPSRRTVQRRLRALLDEGLIRSALQGDALHHANVHALTRCGIDRLVERGIFTDPPEDPPRLPRPQKLAHLLAIRDVFVSIRLAARAGHFELTEFEFDADLTDDPGLRTLGLIPDGRAFFSVGREPRVVAVEVDLGTETVRTLREKFERYARSMAPNAFFSAPGCSLLVTVSRPSRKATVERLLGELGLGPRARVVLAGELDAHLASEYSRSLFVPVVRAERTPPRPQVADFTAVPTQDDAAFRPIRR